MSKIAGMVKNCIETKSLPPKDSFPDINANWNMQWRQRRMTKNFQVLANDAFFSFTEKNKRFALRLRAISHF